MSTPHPEPPRLPAIPPGTEACGCCAGVEPVTPQRVENRGGLDRHQLPHRHLGGLPRKPACRAVVAGFRRCGASPRATTTTSASACWTHFACAADVLTFYQERIANESWLTTARERVSLEEMGRLIGYRLRPGVAAETLLAFTLETPPVAPAAAKPEPGMFVTGVPAKITIDPGLAVRSVPAPGETPQVFETVEALEARPAWNALRPWMSDVVVPARGDTFSYLAGVNTKLRPGDALLFVGGEYFANHDANEWDFRILDRVAADVANDRTFVSWRRPLGSINPPQHPPAQPRVFALRRRAAVYGHNAPLWFTMPADFQTSYIAKFDPPTGPVLFLMAASTTDHPDWPRFLLTPKADEAGEPPAGRSRCAVP